MQQVINTGWVGRYPGAMRNLFRFTIVLAAALVAAWVSFRFAKGDGRGSATAARTELALSQTKISALQEENRRLSAANAELQATLNARAQAAAAAAAKKTEPALWELMARLRRDKSASLTLSPFDSKTGRMSEGLAGILALTAQEKEALDRAVDEAHRELGPLMLQHAVFNKVDGKVQVTVQPFPEGAAIQGRVLQTLADTLGPDRFEVLNANIRNGNGMQQAFGGFGDGSVSGTIIRVPTEDGTGTRFRVGLRVANAMGSSSATNVDATTPAALPESMRWLNALVPDLESLPVSGPDIRPNIAPDPLGMRAP